MAQEQSHTGLLPRSHSRVQHVTLWVSLQLRVCCPGVGHKHSLQCQQVALCSSLESSHTAHEGAHRRRDGSHSCENQKRDKE